MINLYKNIKADIFKLLHSKLLLLHLLVPVVGISVFCGYYSYSPWSETDKLLVYIQAVAMAFPLMISVATSMMYEQELKAGNFQTILSAPYSKVVSHSGNLISLCLFGLFASVFTVLGFGIVFRIMGFVKFSTVVYFKLSLVLFLSNITLYLLQYIICFIAGKGVSLSFGIIGTLLSPLLYLGLGDKIWSYIPFGYGIRMSTYYNLKYTDINTYKTIVQDFKIGVITAGVITIILIGIFLIWSNLWQGSNIKQE
ncbi:MAG TPA: lantibiotic immunity ABC transporter MutG family permease subunit [Mobilitalea sp.]|nr:lantibiotic immunity ABC transporter MutG family permease subunit [Mobilitalea sp.]